MQVMWVQSLGREDPLEEEMATHSSVLAWRIPWTEEPGGLRSRGSQRVGHNRATNSFASLPPLGSKASLSHWVWADHSPKKYSDPLFLEGASWQAMQWTGRGVWSAHRAPLPGLGCLQPSILFCRMSNSWVGSRDGGEGERWGLATWAWPVAASRLQGRST